MRRTVVAAAIVSLLCIVAVPSDAKAKPPLRTVSCGETILKSLRVANDLEFCPGVGLNVGASNVILDLNGHTIHGDGTGNGIKVAGNLSRVSVRNGRVTGFNVGIDVPSTDRVTISRVTVTGNSSYGIYFEHSTRALVTRNVVARNFDDGIYYYDTTGAISKNTSFRNDAGIYLDSFIGGTVSGNRVYQNVKEGLELASADSVKVVGNVFSDNDEQGIHADPSSNSLFMDNLITDNTLSGIEADSGSGNRFIGNTVLRNGANGIFLDGSDTASVKDNRLELNGFAGVLLDGSDNVDIIGNRAKENIEHAIQVFSSLNTLIRANLGSQHAGSGVLVHGASSGINLIRNTMHHNGEHGIESTVNAITLTKNTTNHNGHSNGIPGVGLGIAVPAGTTNSGNRASGNDDPNQCEASDVNCFVP
jgi:parallel beta-helix repeat protein